MQHNAVINRLVIVASSLGLGIVLVAGCGGHGAPDQADHADHVEHVSKAAADEAPANIIEGWQPGLTRAHQADKHAHRAPGTKHWSHCFAKRETYRSWLRIQIGMPRCTVPNKKQASRHAANVVDSHCFKNPNHWVVYSKRMTLVCLPKR